jgi:group I intron endonuclease
MIVYIATNAINRKRYVGMTEQSLAKRIRDHRLAVRKGSKTAFHSALRNYGFENFTFEAVASARTREALQKAEREIIAQECTIAPLGYNLTTGGDGRSGKMPDYAVANMVAAQKRIRAAETSEQKLSRNRAISAAKKGKSQPWCSANGSRLLGIKRQDDFRNKVSSGVKSYISALPPGEMSRRAKTRWKTNDNQKSQEKAA